MPSRRGKKSWKKIDTASLEDAQEQETRNERQGLRVDKLADSELFVIDSTQDAGLISTISSRRKKEKRPLRCQVIIGAAQKARPVNSGSSKPKLKGPATPKKRIKREQVATRAAEYAFAGLELWDNEADKRQPRPQPRSRGLFEAVEVDAPGCSFNPDLEQHQDAIAAAVAVEMTKQYANEMIPEPVRISRLPQPDELDQLLVDDDESEQEEAMPADDLRVPRKQPQKKTRADRNRDKRRRDAESRLKAKDKLKKQRRDLAGLPQLQAALQAEEAVQAARAARRAADKEEARKNGPPRLGKHKFEPSPMQVLLSEEISGSLRQLKGSAMLAGERFKSLQKRGIIAPPGRRPAGKQRRRRRMTVAFAPGASREKLEASHEETKRIVREGAKARGATAMVEG